jgi:DinB family protein
MTGKEVLTGALTSTQWLMTEYLKDLSDADLLVRPAPSANHIAWQLGHVIHSEMFLIKVVVPNAAYPDLPKGFGEKHTKETSKQDSGFLTKKEYLELFGKVRQATLDTLKSLSDADLDKPNTGRMAQFAPTVGAQFLLISNHTLMHGGQFTVVRRKLEKPVLF